MAGEEYTSLINFLKREGLTDRVAKVMCPKCGSMNDICCLPCGCRPPRYVHFLKGCSRCGMKFGEGKFQVHGIECENCRHKLDFFGKYPWRREYIGLKTRGSLISKGTGIALILGCIIGFLLFMYLNQNNSQSDLQTSIRQGQSSRVQEQGVSPEQKQPSQFPSEGYAGTTTQVPSTSQSTDGSPDQGETPEEPQYGYQSSPSSGGYSQNMNSSPQSSGSYNSTRSNSGYAPSYSYSSRSYSYSNSYPAYSYSYSYSYHSGSYSNPNLPSYSQSYYYSKSYRVYSQTYPYPNQNPYPPQPYPYSANFPYGH